MRKRFWKTEYSITIFVIFAVVLLLLPTSFITSKEAGYITKWNDTYNKIDYMFSAMNAHSDANIIKGLKKAKSYNQRENFVILLIKPYLRLVELDDGAKKYEPHYMNGNRVEKNDQYHFDSLYTAPNGEIVGIKDVKDDDIYHPGFYMMFDINGFKSPNVWGKDIYGINIFSDGKITPIGSGWDLEDMKNDCSEKGTGISCSNYYRIGGEFNE